jgi:hypothetical protein
LFQAHLGRDFITVALNNSVFVVNVLKVDKSQAHLLHGGEVPIPEKIFFEYADKALGAAVAFRGLDKSWRTGNIQESNFFLEIVRHILTAMVMSEAQAPDRE